MKFGQQLYWFYTEGKSLFIHLFWLKPVEQFNSLFFTLSKAHVT